ncbi:uncharacterized protein LOC144167450 isoform X2 [Haemaphysalis longicornis]
MSPTSVNALGVLLVAGLVLFVVPEEPDFMNQVMPVICAATQNLTRRIWYLACVEYLMEYGLENDANYCFGSVNTKGWDEAFRFFCGDKECFSDRVNENVMYDARDVDKMLQPSSMLPRNVYNTEPVHAVHQVEAPFTLAEFLAALEEVDVSSALSKYGMVWSKLRNVDPTTDKL